MEEDKKVIEATAMRYALKPDTLYVKIFQIKEDYKSIKELSQYSKDLIIRSFENKKDLWQLVCGVNYFCNHISYGRDRDFDFMKSLFKELLNYRTELIAYKIVC